MCNQSVTDRSVALLLDKSELCSLGLDDDLSGAAVRRLVTSALSAGGQTPWPEMETEIYMGNDTILILARPAHSDIHSFSFDNFEDMLSAAAFFSIDFPGSLTYLDGNYYLSLRCRARDIPNQVYEYGAAVECADGFTAHLAEYGDCIIKSHALSLLQEYFS